MPLQTVIDTLSDEALLAMYDALNVMIESDPTLTPAVVADLTRVMDAIYTAEAVAA